VSDCFARWTPAAPPERADEHAVPLSSANGRSRSGVRLEPAALRVPHVPPAIRGERRRAPDVQIEEVIRRERPQRGHLVLEILPPIGRDRELDERTLRIAEPRRQLGRRGNRTARDQDVPARTPGAHVARQREQHEEQHPTHGAPRHPEFIPLPQDFA
jgi:hypothetical protein